MFRFFVHPVSNEISYSNIKGIVQRFMIREVGGLTGDRLRVGCRSVDKEGHLIIIWLGFNPLLLIVRVLELI